MKAILTSLVLACACGGPSQQQIADTPAAHAKRSTGEAPAASTSDKDREQLVNSFDDQQAAQKARAEAGKNAKQPPPPVKPPADPPPTVR